MQLEFADSSMVSVNRTAVENELYKNTDWQSELDCPIYNDPFGYVDFFKDDLEEVSDYASLRE